MREAIREALLRDERVFLMGEDVGRYGGCFAVSKGLLEEFGPERIRDTPLSESAFVGAGIGAAMGGMRPIVEIMTVNFSLLALDQIVNNAATMLHMSGGQFNVPLVIRMTTGAGRQLAAQHSHSLEGWYAHIPGHQSADPGDAGGCARHALDRAGRSRSGADLRARHRSTTWRASWRRTPAPVDIDQARRSAGPATTSRLITYGGTLFKTLEAAADDSPREGIDAEVIDLRTLRPLDDGDHLDSVSRTHRAVIVDEGWRSGSISAEIMRADHGTGLLRARRAGGAGLQRRSADALSQAPRRGGDPAGAETSSAAARRGGDRPWVSSACPLSAPTWSPARSSIGACKPGDTVKRGDVVAVVETEKGVIEVEIFDSGVVESLVVQPGQKVPVGATLAIFARTEGHGSAAAPPPRASRGAKEGSAAGEAPCRSAPAETASAASLAAGAKTGRGVWSRSIKCYWHRRRGFDYPAISKGRRRAKPPAAAVAPHEQGFGFERDAPGDRGGHGALEA